MPKNPANLHRTSSTGSAATAPPREVWSVSRLNLEVRALIDSGLGHVWIEGEISNFAHPRSGHMYFSLKDSNCQVRCAMFRGQNSRLQFTPANGQQVLLRGRAGLYAERGEFQIVADYMEEGGVGALRRAFDALKTRLSEEGLFDAERKQALPQFVRQVGILSSSTGAALHDILTTLKRRYPALPVIVYPVPVQGTQAPPAIIRALDVAQQRRECDVLIIARGGGSLEDLWAFNDEAVARAIAACAIPIVAGIGHEVDYTIADFAADLRAATPTAAAEAVSPDSDTLRLRVNALRHRTVRNTNQALAQHRRAIDAVRRRLKHPATRVQELTQRSDLLMLRLQRALETRMAAMRSKHAQLASAIERHHPAARLANLRLRSSQARKRLDQAMHHSLLARSAQLDSVRRTLRSVGPGATLARGYAVAMDSASGAILRNATDTKAGTKITVQLATGELLCTVDAAREGPR